MPVSTGRWRPLLASAVALTITSVGKCRVPTPPQNLIAAVYDRNPALVRRLIASGADLEQRKSDGSTPLLLSVETDQFAIAETLIDSGADIWATSEFGDTVGWATEHSRLKGGVDERARRRVLVKLRGRGFPFPAAHRSFVLQRIRAGDWPPKTR